MGNASLVSIPASQAISAMVAPVVLVTAGGVLLTGVLNAWISAASHEIDVAQERRDILAGPDGELRDPRTLPASDRERLSDLDGMTPLLLRRIASLRFAASAIYVSMMFLIAAIIALGIGDTIGSIWTDDLALALVLAGSLGLGIAVAIAVTLVVWGLGPAEFLARRGRKLSTKTQRWRPRHHCVPRECGSPAIRIGSYGPGRGRARAASCLAPEPSVPAG